MILECTNLAAF